MRRLLVLVLVLALPTLRALATPAPPNRADAAGWVGAAACARCHAAETAAWTGSHHDRAMEKPTPATVAAPFAGERFTKDGVTSTFTRRGDAYLVRTDGPDGALHDYDVAWTFGVEPLQQYLVAMPGGRLQSLGIAWDTRPKADGGQRWFHLYPDEHIDHRDELHWTAVQQNWNFTCAECHSTNLVKRYDAATDGFATTWTDVDVACEACHGPGAAHVAWAEAQASAHTAPPPGPAGAPRHGLTVTLADAGTWTFAPGAPIARRSAPPPSAQLETCGRCHARGAQLWPDDAPGTPLAQTHRVSLLEPGLYHADGQIDGEVYEYGSFLQSRMHAAGVQCSDCHDPHSAKLRAPGNVLCAQCHAPPTYDVPAHHHHATGSPGAQCVACHMPEKVYMIVDGRRDHSFRVPRPDLTVTIGTPNACSACHGDRPATWAAEQVAAWRGPRKPPPWHWGEAIHAGRTNAAGALEQLLRAAGDAGVPGIARATAVTLLGGQGGPRIQPALAEASRDADPLVRRAAAETAALVLPPPERVALAGPLLRDPMRSVRFEALGSVLDVPPARRTGIPAAELDRVIAEYRASQAYNGDRAEAWFNLGQLDARLGDAAAAEQALETAIRRAPAWAAPYVQLADVQRATGREAAAEATLRRAVASAPAAADAHAALGLALVRQKRAAEALPALRRAAELAPGDPRHAWVYAIALHDGGDAKAAIDVLRRAQERHPNAPDLLATLAQYSAEAGDRAAALAWARRLADLTGDPSARRMVEQLERQPTPAP